MPRRCPKCSSEAISKHGFTSNATHRQRYTCRDCGHRTTNPVASDVAPIRADLPKRQKYVITTAQNATPVFKPFIASLRHYCQENDAELGVIATRYRNPTTQLETKEHEWWAPEVVPNLFRGRVEIVPGLVILGDVKVQPTAVSPLTGLDSITGGKAGIVGHPKIAYRTVATPQHRLPKIMATTGCVTERNYSDSKAGKKGEFHHCFSALLVETDGHTFHLRQLNATNAGSFIDLDKEYCKDGIDLAARAAGLVIGDLHERFVDPDVVEATFGSDGMCEVMQPREVIYHDSMDFHSRKHHHRGKPFIGLAKHKARLENVRAEIEETCAFIDRHTPSNARAVVVPSNHTDGLMRWLEETDWRYDPENAEFYLETALAVARSARMGEGGAESVHPFNYWAKKHLNRKALLLERDDSHLIKNIEVGMHGDRGLNGARGNINAFSHIGVKSVIGHTHSPGIVGACYQVGTSSRLRLEYNSGPSGWLNTHCIIYANGKRSLISVIDGKWRA